MEKTQKSYVTPLAIVAAGALIAIGLFFGLKGNQPSLGAQPDPYGGEAVDTTSEIRPVTKDDHIKGSLDAPVKIVEYSDFECPFCQRFHDTMNEVMAESTGDIAWVYRHFPLDQLHPRNARKVAVASECVNELGGNDAFWKFTDGYFRISPSNDQTNYDQVVPTLIAEVGVDKGQFDACVASGKYDSHVQDDVDNAVATGGQGTPWSVVIAPNGTTFPLSGAQPAESVRQLIELAKKER